MSKYIDRGRKALIKAVNDYRTDLWFRAEASVHISTGVNLTYSMYQAMIGLTRKSAWFDALAVYYILLTATRVLMLYYIRKEAADGREELRRYRTCGIMMFFLTFTVLIIGLLVNNGSSAPKEYPGHLVFVVGVFTFYNLINSSRNLWNYRKLESPLISASKSINLAASLVSLYAFQTAAIAQFRQFINPSVITLLNVFTVGAGFIAVLYISMHIIVRASRALHGKEDLYIVVDEKKTNYQKEFQTDVKEWIANTGKNLPDWAREMSDFSDQFNSRE